MPSATLVLLLIAGFTQELQTVERIQPEPQLGNAPPPAPAGKAVLGGRVVNARTKEPIKKARVMLNGPTNLSAVTDSNGSFTFRALPPGGYVVSAGHEEFYADAGVMNFAQTSLSEGEEKQDVEVKLTPGAAITGRVVDEDELPVPQCSVTAMRSDSSQNPPRMVNNNSANTDGEGTFRLHTLQGGRYILKAQCPTVFQAPHGFMKRNDPLVPHEGYGPAYLGDGDIASPLSGVPVQAGGELTGMDFHVKRIPVYSVSGTLSGVDQNLLSGGQVVLAPLGSTMPEVSEISAGMDRSRERYLFRDVPAGSYEVIATVFNGEHAFEGRQTIDVGKTQLTEFAVKLSPGAVIPGAVEVDDPAGKRFENMRISLQPLTANYHGPFPMATLGADGNFEFKSVLPGRFRLNPLPMGYIKSLSIAGRDVSPQDFEVSGEAAGPMHITVGSKMGRLDVDVYPKPGAGQPVSALLIPEDTPGPRNAAVSSGKGELGFEGVAPGKYRVLVLLTANPWSLLGQTRLLTSLGSRAVEVEVAEGETKKVSAPVLSAEDLQKALDAAE